MEIKVINVAPRDVYVTFEMSLDAIDMVLEALDHAIIEVDPNDMKLTAADKFIKNEFFKTLNDVFQEVKR